MVTTTEKAIERVIEMGTSRVYVSTYAKYNEGSLKGKWLDLGDYSTHEEFISACLELHCDEGDPELMFQDFECFPDNFYSECSIDESVWE